MTATKGKKIPFPKYIAIENPFPGEPPFMRKRKKPRPEDEPAHPDDDRHDEVYSNDSSYVQFNKFGQGVIATFSKGPVSSALKGGHIASKSNVLCKVKPLSCFDDISGSSDIVQCEKGLETNKTIGVEI